MAAISHQRRAVKPMESPHGKAGKCRSWQMMFACKQMVYLPVEIFNPSDSPAQHLVCGSSHRDVRWEQLDSLRGIWSYSPVPVAPKSGKTQKLRILPSEPGPFTCTVSCQADHGGSCSMQLTGHVEGGRTGQHLTHNAYQCCTLSSQVIIL